jgi:hypothetical protein
MDWAIYGALIVGFLAFVGGAIFLVVRISQAWRAFKRSRRQFTRELDKLYDAADRTAAAMERAGDQTKLNEAAGRLRPTLAQFAVLRAAVAEATAAYGRVTAVVPRK